MLFAKTVEVSRKKVLQPALRLRPLDTFVYQVLANDHAVFGDFQTYRYFEDQDADFTPVPDPRFNGADYEPLGLPNTRLFFSAIRRGCDVQ